MKNTPDSQFRKAQFVTAGKRRYVHYFSFAKKDAIIRNIEIIGACAIALLAGFGMYGLFN